MMIIKCIILCSILSVGTMKVLAQPTVRPTDTIYRNPLSIRTIGFNKVEINSNLAGTIYRKAIGRIKTEYGLSETDSVGKFLLKTNKFPVLDEVPVTLSEICWLYQLKNDKGEVIGSAETSKEWPASLFPSLVLPKHPGWVKLYQKAWELNWKRIVTSKVLPARFAYNATTDNGMSYVWDACFNLLFQRYAAMAEADAGVATLDNFYALQTKEGFIHRHFNTSSFQSGHPRASLDSPAISGVNPPLFAWAEWDYFLITADRDRIKKLLPILIKQYDFIESFLQQKPGRYLWDGNPSGWDNILEIQPHKYWVELPAMQALSAECIVQMANELHESAIAKRFEVEKLNKQMVMKVYWNKDKNWYCSLDSNGGFTGKTLSGLWAMLAGIVPIDHARSIRDNLMDTAAFFTSPMPLPSVAKNENGYDPKGRYWHGSVWINTSLMAIRGLERYGYWEEAKSLAEKTLDGMADVYEHWNKNPYALWECYAPEFAAPASHKKRLELGEVRADFADWTSCLINLLIENVMGITIDASKNSVTWNLRLKEEHGVRNLRFATVTTDLIADGNMLSVSSNKPFKLFVVVGKKKRILQVKAGQNHFDLAMLGLTT